MPLPSLQDDLAEIRANAAQARGDEALAPMMAGAGGRPTFGVDLQGAGEALADSPIAKVGQALVDTAGWVKKLPANLSKGALDAVVATGRGIWDGLRQSIEEQFVDQEGQPDAPKGTIIPQTPAELREESDVWTGAPHKVPEIALDEQAGIAYDNWRRSISEDDTLADGLTQGIAQFTVPFLSFSKAFGVTSAATKVGMFARGAAAEGAAVYTAFDPASGRMADLLDLGRHAEGKFGDTMRTLAPDDSLANQYINWMTDRTGETGAKGRFKNALDNTVVSAAAAGLLKSASSTFKTAREFAAVPRKIARLRRLREAQSEEQYAAEMREMLQEEISAEETRTAYAAQSEMGGGAAPSNVSEFRFNPDKDLNAILAAAEKVKRPDGTVAKEDMKRIVDSVIGREPVKSEVKPAQSGFAETSSGLVFKDEKDAQGAVEELAHQFGPGFEQRQADAWAKSSDKNFATLHSFANVLRANVDKPVSTHSLVTALEKNIKGDTETGAFYKELLGRLKGKNLGGMTVVASESPGTARGGYVPKANAVKIYERAFESPEKLLHTFTHEAVHAATVREVRESATASSQINALHKKLAKAFEGTETGKQYGFKDPEEFIAEIESNPEFRKTMKKVKIDGESAWDKYRKAIGGILGIGTLALSPEFDKLMDPKQEEGEDQGA